MESLHSPWFGFLFLLSAPRLEKKLVIVEVLQVLYQHYLLFFSFFFFSFFLIGISITFSYKFFLFPKIFPTFVFNRHEGHWVRTIPSAPLGRCTNPYNHYDNSIFRYDICERYCDQTCCGPGPFVERPWITRGKQ